MKKIFILFLNLIFVFSLSTSIALAGGGQNLGEKGLGQTEEEHQCSGTALDCVWNR